MVKYSTLLRTVGNGEDTTFSPGFSSDNSSDIEVYIDNTKNNQWTEVDGNIVFDIPPAEGSIIAIYRVTDPLQLPEFTPNTPITAGTLNSLRDLTEKGIKEAYDVGFDALQNYINVQGAIEDSIAAADAAAQSENSAADSESKAYQWAEADTNVEVEPGEYSSKHYAMNSKVYADSALNTLQQIQGDDIVIDGGTAGDTVADNIYDGGGAYNG